MAQRILAHSRSLGFKRFTPARYHNTISCWDCGKCDVEGDSIFFWCDCGAIQPLPEDANYFEIFGFEPTVDIDHPELERRFRDAQRLLHPDKFANSSRHEKKLSADNSSVVNVAYQTLRSPLQRTRYLLEQKNIKVFQESESTSRYVDPMFLMEMVELREKIQESKSNTYLEKIKKLNKTSITKSIQALSKHFKTMNKEALSEEAVRLQFFTKVDEEVDDAMGMLIK